MPRKFLNHPDTFCYLCSELTFKSQMQNFIPLINKCYKLYFGCKVGDQDKSWALYICCVICVRLLTGWVNGSHQMTFTVPMVRREPKDHSTIWYFHLTNILAITSKSKHTVKYPDLPLQQGLSHTVKSCLFQSLWKIWLLAMTTLILMKIMDSEKGKMLIVIWHLKQNVTHLNPIY